MIQLIGNSSLSIQRYIVPVVEVKKQNASTSSSKLKQHKSELNIDSRKPQGQLYRRKIDVDKERD